MTPINHATGRSSPSGSPELPPRLFTQEFAGLLVDCAPSRVLGDGHRSRKIFVARRIPKIGVRNVKANAIHGWRREPVIQRVAVFADSLKINFHPEAIALAEHKAAISVGMDVCQSRNEISQRLEWHGTGERLVRSDRNVVTHDVTRRFFGRTC